jgi:hypothetical protein
VYIEKAVLRGGSGHGSHALGKRFHIIITTGRGGPLSERGRAFGSPRSSVHFACIDLAAAPKTSNAVGRLGLPSAEALELLLRQGWLKVEAQATRRASCISPRVDKNPGFGVPV